MARRAARADALAMFRAAVAAAQPDIGVRRCVLAGRGGVTVGGQWLPFAAGSDDNGDAGPPPQVLVVGGGKAVLPMTTALASILHSCGDDGERPRVYGHVVTKYDHADGIAAVDGTDVTVGEAAHPVPDAACVDNSSRILSLVRSAPPGTLVFALLTGGGSSLLTLPAPGIPLDQYQNVTEQLLGRGAPIEHLNTMRKHLSAVAGGRLAAAGSHVRLVTLALSDVVGDPVDVIASGPTVADSSTVAGCHAIVKQYGLSLPPAVAAHLDSPAAAAPVLAPCPAGGLQPVQVVGSNRLALLAAAEAARDLGYHAAIMTSTLTGEASQAAKVVASLATEAARPPQDAARERPFRAVPDLPAVLLFGGETTVSLGDDPGRGGRNQELALAAAVEVAGLANVTVLACGTDGTDGPTDATGGLVDGGTVAAAAAVGMDARDHLARHDAYPVLEAVGDDTLVRTGPTGTNVMDITIAVVAD